MTYLKSTLIGIVTAFIAVLIVVLAMLRVWMSDNSGGGGGGMYVSIDSWQILLAASVGFAVGFWLSLRRSRVRQA